MATEVKRHAAVYVFCLLHHQDKATLDPMDLSQWTFYVLPAATLNTKVPTASSISLAKLLTLEPITADFSSVSQAVQALNVERG